MRVIRVRNVHQALPLAIDVILREGVDRQSRNGPVLVHPEPVATVYERPLERVLFWPARDANPFFHLAEACWMLAGRNDVAFPTRFVKTFGQYSDDGDTFHGAYGHRWRCHFGFDQLTAVVDELRRDPDSRRVVLQMWSAPDDLGRNGKDLPCNTHAYFSVGVDGRLNMTVCCRSNDIIWGAYGANAVHFSYLQEYVAAALAREVGTYTQISNNWHAYLKTLEPLRFMASLAPDPFTGSTGCPYTSGRVEPFALVKPGETAETVVGEITELLAGSPVLLTTVFARRVLRPLLEAHALLREKDNPRRFDGARDILLVRCLARDWQAACLEWISRRERKFQEKEVA